MYLPNRLRKIALALIVVLGLSSYALAQNRTVSGTVTDINGEPIIGASVLLDGTTIGVVTDLDGKFSISAPLDGTIIISYIGYKQQRIPLGGKTDISVTVEEDATQLGEVTIVAYGKKRKQDLVGSVSSVKPEIIGNSQAASVSNALEGTVAGLQIVSSTGQPGEDAKVSGRFRQATMPL